MVKEDSCPFFFNFGSLTSFLLNIPFTLNLFEI